VLWPAAAVRYRTLLLIMVNRGIISGPGCLHRMTGWGSLTDTEQAVVGLVAEGLNNRH
jgi:hypothetical protein